MQFGDQNFKNLVNLYYCMKCVFSNTKKFVSQRFIEIGQLHDSLYCYWQFEFWKFDPKFVFSKSKNASEYNYVYLLKLYVKISLAWSKIEGTRPSLIYEIEI